MWEEVRKEGKGQPAPRGLTGWSGRWNTLLQYQPFGMSPLEGAAGYGSQACAPFGGRAQLHSFLEGGRGQEGVQPDLGKRQWEAALLGGLGYGQEGK